MKLENKKNLKVQAESLDFILENIDELVILVDDNFSIEFVNYYPLKEILGYNIEKLLGEEIINFLKSTEVIKFRDFINGKIRNLKNSVKISLKDSKNKYIPFNLTSRNIQNKGEVKHILIFKPPSESTKLQDYLMKKEEDIKNITKELPEIRFWKLFTPEKYDEALESSYKMLNQVMENIPQHILWKDKKLNYLGCNENYAEFIGIDDPELIIGKKDKDIFINQERVKQLEKSEKSVINSNKSKLHKIESWKTKKGDDIILDTNRIPMRNSKGEIVGILITYEDITEKVLSEKKVKQSEQKYRHLVESSPYGIALIDRNGKIIDCNTSINNFLSAHTSDYLVGKDFREIFSMVKENRSIIPFLEEKLQIFTKSQKETSFEFKIHQTKGNKIWVNLRATNVNFDNQNLIQVILQDITEEKLYEDLIKKINESFLNFTTDIVQNISSLLNTGLTLLNGNLGFYVNKIEQESSLKYKIISHKGNVDEIDLTKFQNSLFAHLFSEDRNRIQADFNLNEKDYDFINNYSGENQIVSCISEILGPYKERNGLVVIFFQKNQKRSDQDTLVLSLISKAIEIEQQRWEVKKNLEKQNVKLSELNRLKTELLSRISHELKTPLISIKGFTELLMTIHKEELSSEIFETLKMIEKGSKRLQKIINVLLKASKLEKNRLDLKIKENNLSDLVKEILSEFEGIATMRKHEIILDIDENILLDFDKNQIKELISNILLNSIKFTPPGGLINIRTELTNDSVILSINDNGIGFTEEEKRQLFTRFGKIERYNQNLDVIIEGAGLGLFISKKLIELHGGKIWMESKGRNKGSTFFISLPR
jgi:PAS domain S-box-containing protein